MPNFDIKKLFDAARAISGEMVIENLLVLLMDVVVENVCAQRGFLFLRENGHWRIEAETSADCQYPADIRKAVGEHVLPALILAHISKTHETVVLANATESERFKNDPYVRDQKPLSVLCMPLMNRGQLQGALYVENNLASGAFLPEHVEALGLLASQAAISMDNAKLYRKYSSLYENAVEGIFQIGPDSRILSANPASAAILGWDSPEAMISGLKNTAGIYVDPEARDEMIATIQEKGRVIGYETRVYKKNKEIIWISVSSRSILDRNGNLLYYEGFFVNVTEKKKREKAERAREAAEAANRSKSEFLADMSHEIRTPLNAVLGFSELLMEKITDPDHQKYLKNIHFSGKLLLLLINDILDLSKIESGMLEIRLKPMDIRNVVNEVRGTFLTMCLNKGIEIRTEIGDSVPDALMMDETRFRQVLNNLAGNAVKFTDNGFVRISLRSSDILISENGRKTVNLFLEVEDSGIGVPEDQLATIFMAFRQRRGQETERYGGTGLGLAITKKLVGLMNGDISVESTEGKGSAFRIIFYEVGIADQEAEEDKVPRPGPIGAELKPATIMIVDDASLNRSLLKGFLEGSPISIIEAESGDEALALLQPGKPGGKTRKLPDLIFMDIRMPGKDGYETTEIIKRDDRLRRIPVIAFSASAMKSDAILIKSLFDDYLQKPITGAKLVSVLKKHIRKEPAKNGPKIGQREGLGKTVKMIDEELLPRVEKLIATPNLDATVELADELMRVADKYGVTQLKDYALKLSDAKSDMSRPKWMLLIKTC